MRRPFLDRISLLEVCWSFFSFEPMNLIELMQSEELAGLNEKFIAKSSSVKPSSPTCIDDIIGDPILSPRLGDDYQVEIPSMLAESEQLLTFELDLKTGLTIPIMWVHKDEMRKELKDIKCSAVAGCTSNSFSCNDLLTSSLALKGEIVGSLLNHKKTYLSSTYQITQCKGCSPLPESRVSLWSDDEVQCFLLGLYIFGKNMVQVRKFIEFKDMGDILSFYYGKFYHSDAYHRWSGCRKTRSRKCIQGQRIFTGWRQQEVLSRILTGMSKEVRDSLLEATKTFNEGRSSLEELVFSLKAAAGICALIEAVGIGRGNQDLTGFVQESSRTNQAIPSSAEIPIGKACSTYSSADLIKFLSGNFRFSKARSNDLFWETVWPRLLARGWHSERPRNICSKKTLVFLIPGIRKFSRRKLVKGDHYFDSVTDLLNRVASDPQLLELQTEGGSGSNNLSSTFSDHHRHPSYLRPRVVNSNTELIKFTVVDTSLVDSATSSCKLRELRSMPFEVMTNNDIEGTSSDSSMDSSIDPDPLKEASMKATLQINQPEVVQFDKKIQPEQSACLAPLLKRQRLSACKQAMRNGCHKLFFLGEDESGVKPAFEDRFYEEKTQLTLFDLNQPQFPMDFDAEPLKQPNADGARLTGNPTGMPDEEPCLDGRRHSTRNRPPTAKALEALANGFLHIGQAGKGLKNSRWRGLQSRSRFPHRKGEAPPLASSVFTKASIDFIDPNFIIPDKMR